MNDSSLSLKDALSLLRSFSCTIPKLITSEAEKEQLRQAVSTVIEASEWENLGICANTSEEAFKSLNRYLKALGYPLITNSELEQNLTQGVYLKYNSQKQSYYVDSYSGEYRGVLLSCQGENEEVTGTYGHLPLDLFES